MDININAQQALALLKEAVDERGSDYCYDTEAGDYRRIALGFAEGDGPGCFYLHDDGPGCIAGLALFKAGVPLEMLGDMDMASKRKEVVGGTGVTSLVSWLAERRVHLTARAARVLRSAQTVQDAEGTWGRALHDARCNPLDEVE